MTTAVDPNAVARVLGIKTTFKNLRGGAAVSLPQRIAVVGQGNTAAVYSTDKAQVTSAFDVATTYGFGSPLHLAVLQLLPDNGDGVGIIPVTVYPLIDDGASVVAAGDVTPAGLPDATGSFKIRVNNIDSEAFLIAANDSVAVIVTAMTAAVNASLNLPVIAVDSTTTMDLTSKWEGASANDIVVEVVGPTDINVTFGITQLVGGLNNPDVTTATAQIGNVFETLVLNCMDVADTDTLDLFQTFGDGRWGATVRKPLVVFTGDTTAAVASAIAISDARPTDKVNSQLVSPGSNDLPLVVAARQLARIAVVANNNPPTDYGSQQATGLVPGVESDQWDSIDREVAVKAGSSTVQVKDGIVNISDVVTFYHPTGDPTPAFRHVVDIIKLQNIIFNLDLIFATPEWDGAPLIPDDQPTTNPLAKKPKSAKSAIASLLDSLGLEAIISDPETAKESIIAVIDSGNSKRLNVTVTVQLSGNTNIISVDLDFGFFFGTLEAA